MTQTTAATTIQQEMEKLNAIRTAVTPSYLETATESALRDKLKEIDNIVKTIIDMWEATNPGDLVDEAAVGWDSKKQEAYDVRDMVKAVINDKIKTLTEEKAKTELKGAEEIAKETALQPETSVSALMTTLGDLHTQLTTELKEVTAEYIKTSSKATLVAKKKSILTLYTTWKQIFHKIDKTKITAAQGTLIQSQRQLLLHDVDQVEDKLQSRIRVLDVQEAQVQVVAIQAAKTKAEKDADEAVKRAEEEKRLKDEALQQIEDLKKQLSDAQNQPLIAAPQGVSQEEFEREQKDKQKALDDLEEMRKKFENINVDELRGSVQKAERERKEAQTKLDEAQAETSARARERDEAQEQVEKQRNLDRALKNLERKFEELSKARNEDDYMSDEDVVVGAPTRKKTDNVIQLKIDTVTIPYFSGDLLEWISFRDFFEYLVHNNKNLSDSLKFHQLKTHLRGQALDTIRGYHLSDQTYASAWADLIKRYDRKEDLVQAYIRKFLEIPAITSKPTFMKLRAIVDGTNQMRRALPTFEVAVTNWDPWMSLIIFSKLDEQTRQDWKQKIGGQEFTKVTELLEFIETRAVELQPNQGDRLVHMLRGDACRRTPKRIFQISPTDSKTMDKTTKGNQGSKLECPLCKGPHRIWNCEKLKAECAKVRTDIIKSLKMCFKCLLKHQIGDCNSEDCTYCNGPHHVLLCYRKENDQKKKLAAQEPNTNFRQTPKNSTPGKRKWNPQPSTSAPRKRTTEQPPPDDDWSDWEENHPEPKI